MNMNMMQHKDLCSKRQGLQDADKTMLSVVIHNSFFSVFTTHSMGALRVAT